MEVGDAQWIVLGLGGIVQGLMIVVMSNSTQNNEGSAPTPTTPTPTTPTPTTPTPPSHFYLIPSPRPADSGGGVLHVCMYACIQCILCMYACVHVFMYAYNFCKKNCKKRI